MSCFPVYRRKPARTDINHVRRDFGSQSNV